MSAAVVIASAAFAVPVPVTGQFEDAEDDPNDSPTIVDVIVVRPEKKEQNECVPKMEKKTKKKNKKTKKKKKPDDYGDGDYKDEADDYDDYNDDYYDDDIDDEVLLGGGGGGGKHYVGHYHHGTTSHAVANALHKMQHLELSHARTMTHTGRDDRATSEQVLDPRTRLILFKLLSKGLLEVIDGCLSTGKEANVYYAKAGAAASRIVSPSYAHIQEYAMKVYKTSILVFKDRDRYVAGETRWRNGYSKSNPRKMVQLWAEKELRNYRRIHAAGIPTPTPILLKSHVLIMEFLGENGWPSPRLKDAHLSETRLRQAYIQCVLILRHLYQRCQLVHADLSEYNLLWHNQRVYVIDCSQSVLSDHPSALDFLRKDITNINDYFRKTTTTTTTTTLNVMTTRQLFDFVTDDTLQQWCDPPHRTRSNHMSHHKDHDVVKGNAAAGAGAGAGTGATVVTDTATAAELDRLDAIMEDVHQHAQSLSRVSDEERRRIERAEESEEAVFMNSFLPRSLNQIQADYYTNNYYEMMVHPTQKLLHSGGPAVVEASSYAQAVAALTLLPPPVLTVKDVKDENADSNVDPARTPYHRSTISKDNIRAAGGDVDADDALLSPSSIVNDDGESDCDHDKENYIDDNDDDDESDSGSESNNRSVSSSCGSLSCSSASATTRESSVHYNKVPRTPQQLEQEKMTVREERRLNKKLVKEAQSEKRKTKVKKKDKKRVIKKAKSGNRKIK